MGADKNDVAEVMNLFETLRGEITGNRSLSVIDRIGGEQILTKIVHTFFDKVIENKVINHFFRRTDMNRLKKHFIDFMAATLGAIPQR